MAVSGGGRVNIKKLLDWRKLLIYSHRWLGIVLGVMFVIWCISGIILMYYAMPRLTAAERLMRMEPLNLSAVQVAPADAAKAAKLTGKQSPSRLRVAMLGNRPIYRMNSGSTWTTIYADTGEPLLPMNADEAKTALTRFLKLDPSKIHYDRYLTTSDLFTLDSVFKQHLPLHRFSVDDGAGTKYYVSERTGEAVLRTDTKTRLLGFFGYSVHRLQWMKEYDWWMPFFSASLWFCILMSLTGIVAGIWRYGLSPRFRHKGVRSHSPYKGWMKWHHYAGLIFGFFILTWMISGSFMGQAIPGVAAPFFGGGRLTPGQQALVTGGAMDLKAITPDGMRSAAAAIGSSFAPKEMELMQFGGKAYFVSYRPPSPLEVDQWETTSISDFIAPALDQEHLFVSATGPDQQSFSRFGDDVMMATARKIMPDVPIQEAVWLNDYDDYYYRTAPTFNSAALKVVRPLPVLRVAFDDADKTLIYLSPTHAQIAKYAPEDRFKRWGYFGFHALDFGFLHNHRPLWDIVTAALLIGCAVLSATTLVPTYRRLKRHAQRLWKWAPRRNPVQKPATQLTMSDGRASGD